MPASHCLVAPWPGLCGQCSQGEYHFVFPVLGINVTSSFAEYGQNTFLLPKYTFVWVLELARHGSHPIEKMAASRAE